MATYIALLRGINVGGNKKVPMSDLKKTLEKGGYANVKTLLNSGNVVFDAKETRPDAVCKDLEALIEKRFGFAVGVLVRTKDRIEKLVKSDPFRGITVKPETRLYVTFWTGKVKTTLKLPYQTPDKWLRILSMTDGEVCSVLTVTGDRGSVDAMEVLEKEFQGGIPTTRNWNTVLKLLR